jgi:integrase
MDHTGKRRSSVFSDFGDAERTLRAHQNATDEVRRGLRAAPPEDRSFDELATYHETHRLPTKRSAKEDRSILNAHLRPEFGRLVLRQISTKRIDAYASTRAHLAPRTVRNHLALLRTMLKKAVSIGWLNSMPEITMPRVEPDEDEEPPRLTANGVSKLLKAARAIVVAEDPHSWVPYVLYATAVYTGLRAGELAGLRWPDVDFERRTIHVKRSYLGKTKTRSSCRHVPVVDALLPVLEDWRQRCPRTELGLLFPNRAGKTRDKHDRVFRETLHYVLDCAGFERPENGRRVHVICFHSLRHTFACNWILNGGSLTELVRVLGHTSARMTEHYANVGGWHRPEHFKLFPSTVQD